MGRYGASILTIAGAVIGSFTPLGPALGAILGSLAGRLLFPGTLPTVNGPRLADITSTTSEVGAPIPRGWGVWTPPINIIAQSAIREVIDSEDVGGKGSPTQTVNTPTYFQDFAIGLNDGNIGGVIAIWANGKIIFDRRPQRADESANDFTGRMAANEKLQAQMVVYLGTEDQDVDPTLEEFYGTGNISAFRGLAYIVFVNWQAKAEDGNRIPANWKVLCYSGGEVNAGENVTYKNEVLYPWLGNAQPLNPLNNNFIFPFSQDGAVDFDYDPDKSLDENLAILQTVNMWPEIVPVGTTFDGAVGEGAGYPTHLGGHPMDEGTFEATLWYAPWVPQYFDRFDSAAFPDIHGPGALVANPGSPFSHILDIPGDVTTLDPDPPYGFYAITGNATRVTWWWEYVPPILVEVQRLPGPPLEVCLNRPTIGGLTNYCIDQDGNLQKAGPWVKTNGNFYVLQPFIGTFEAFGNPPTRKPLDPVLPTDDPRSTEEFWTTAYNKAVAAGTMLPGMTYAPSGNGQIFQSYPTEQGFAYIKTTAHSTVIADTWPLAQIVTDICVEAGLSADDIDVTDLLDIQVKGYVRTRTMAARAALDPLRQAYFFDGYETQGKIKFIRRGGPVQRTFEEDDLGFYVTNAGDGSGETPSKLTTKTMQDVDLPRSVRVSYLSPARDYEQSDQASPSRLDTDAVNDVDVELPIVLDDTEAKQIAEKIWAESWASRWSHQLQVDMQNVDLEPSDAIAVPVDGVLQRMRITNATDMLPSVRKFDLVRDDDAAYTSFAVASPPPFVPQQLGFTSPVELHVFDLPALRDTDDDAGFYAGVTPYATGSKAASVLYRSIDSGSTFTTAGGFSKALTLGQLLFSLPAGVTDTFDNENTITITLTSGALQSRTLEDVIGGANAAAIGMDGRWEIVQFTTVENLGSGSYKLSGLLRGRRGTEHVMGTSVASDTFVLISDSAIARVAMETAKIGAPITYRAVAIGEQLTSVGDVMFTGHGQALVPFDPVDFEAARQDDGSVAITWIRRNRLGQEMPSGADIAMSEATESYDVEIRATISGPVLRTVNVATSSYSYAAADRVTDLSAEAAGFNVTVYQVSATVGRGTPGNFDVPDVFIPPIVYPASTATFTLSGTFDVDQTFGVRLVYSPRIGPAIVSAADIHGTSLSSLGDFAAAIKTLFDSDMPADVVTTVVGNVVTVSTITGTLAGSAQVYAIFASIQERQEALPTTATVQQLVAIDLYSRSTADLAPDTGSAYLVTGVAIFEWKVAGLTYDIETALGGASMRSDGWVYDTPGNTQRLTAIAGLSDSGGTFVHSNPYVQSVGLNLYTGTVQERVTVTALVKPGYRIVETYGSIGYLVGSHPSGYRIAVRELRAGIAGFPSGAKQKDSIYFTATFSNDGTGPTANPQLGDVWTITLDGTDYSHTIDSTDVADWYYTDAALNDLKTQIIASGHFNVTTETLHKPDGSGDFISNLIIERNVANTPFTITGSTSAPDLDIEVANS